MKKLILTALTLTALAAPAAAQPPAPPPGPDPLVERVVPAPGSAPRMIPPGDAPRSAVATAPEAAAPSPVPGTTVVASAESVLAEVNDLRARRGLPPYRLDPALTAGALRCACYRARNRIEGHTGNDFGFLPAGARAAAAGCAAWPVGAGWGSCAIYDRYAFAGAGFCVGPDGRRYMHLFVR